VLRDLDVVGHAVRLRILFLFRKVGDFIFSLHIDLHFRIFVCIEVRSNAKGGLEPPRLAPLDPKSIRYPEMYCSATIRDHGSAAREARACDAGSVIGDSRDYLQNAIVRKLFQKSFDCNSFSHNWLGSHESAVFWRCLGTEW
jgi:hypothetical protein